MPVSLRCLFCFFGLFALTFRERRARDDGEKQIGTACADGANSADFDTLLNASATAAATLFSAPRDPWRGTAPNLYCDNVQRRQSRHVEIYGRRSFQYCISSAWRNAAELTPPTIGSGVYLGASSRRNIRQRSGEVNTGLFSGTGVVRLSVWDGSLARSSNGNVG
jgi:hypothetical protein